MAEYYKNPTRQHMEKLINGELPIKRGYRKPWESQYYYLRPRTGEENESLSTMEELSIPDGVDPEAFKAAGYKVPDTASTDTQNSGLSSMSSPASNLSDATNGFGNTANNGLSTTSTLGNNTGPSSLSHPTNTGLNEQSNSSSPLTPSPSSTTPRQGGYGLLSAMMFDKDAHIAEETEAELKALENAKKNANTFNFGVNASSSSSYPQTSLSSMSGATLSNPNQTAGLTTSTTPAGMGSMGSTSMGLDVGLNNTGLNHTGLNSTYNNGLNFTSTAGLSDSMGLNGLDSPYNTQNVLNNGASSLMGTTPGLSNPAIEPSTTDWVNQVKLATEQKLDQDALTQNPLSPNTGVDSLTKNRAVDPLMPNMTLDSLTQNPAYPTTNLPYQMSSVNELNGFTNNGDIKTHNNSFEDINNYARSLKHTSSQTPGIESEQKAVSMALQPQSFQDPIRRQKEAAMRKHKGVPQFVFDLAEKRAREGGYSSAMDLIMDNAAMTGLGAREGMLGALERATAGTTWGASDKFGSDYVKNRKESIYEFGGLPAQMIGFGTDMSGALGPSTALVKGGLKVASKVGAKSNLAGKVANAFVLPTTGGIEGSLYGAFSEDPETSILGSGLTSAAVATALPQAGKALKFMGSLGKGAYHAAFDPIEQKAFKTIERKFGKEQALQLAEEAQKNGRSIAEMIKDPETLEEVLKLKLKSPAAKAILTAKGQSLQDTGIERVRESVNQGIGGRSKLQTADDITAYYEQKSKPLYQKLEETGDLVKQEIKQNLDNLKPETKFNPNIRKDIPYYTDLLFKRANQAGKEVAGDPNHFILRKQGGTSNRAPFIRTLNYTIKNPDIQFDNAIDGGRSYIAKKYRNTLRNEDFFDFIVKKDGQLWTKFPTDSKYIANQIGDRFSNLPAGRNSVVNIGADPLTARNLIISRIGMLVKENPTIQASIKVVKANRPELNNLPDTDFRVLNEAGKRLSQLSVSSDAGIAYDSSMALKQLHGLMDDVLPPYKQARSMASEKFRIIDAMNNRKNDIFNSSMTSEEFARQWSTLNAAERSALQAKARDVLLSKVGSTHNPREHFLPLFTADVREKLRMVFGDKAAEKIIRSAEQEEQALRNFNYWLGGSQTAEKTSLSDALNNYKNPLWYLGNATKAWNSKLEPKNKIIAQMLTQSPEMFLNAKPGDTFLKIPGLSDLYKKALIAYLSGQTVE